MSYKALVFFFFIVFLSCSPSGKKQPVVKQKDPVIQQTCKTIGKGTCDKNCRKICDDIFSDAEEDCYKFSESLVQSFKKLLDNVKEWKDTNDTNDLNLSALECMLDLEDKGFVSAVKQMSSSSAKRFLAYISENEAPAQILYKEDNEFNIIKQLLKESSNYG